MTLNGSILGLLFLAATGVAIGLGWVVIDQQRRIARLRTNLSRQATRINSLVRAGSDLSRAVDARRRTQRLSRPDGVIYDLDALRGYRRGNGPSYES